MDNHLVIDGAVLLEELGSAVADVVGVRESEVDEEGFAIVLLLATGEIVEDLLGVPCAPGLSRASSFGGVVDDGELLVGG